MRKTYSGNLPVYLYCGGMLPINTAKQKHCVESFGGWCGIMKQRQTELRLHTALKTSLKAAVNTMF